MDNEFIIDAKQKCLAGQVLSRGEIINLLSIPLFSDADNLLRIMANEVAHILTNNSAYIWSAIGADFAPCKMNCEFCSLGEKWGLVKSGKLYSENEIILQAREFVDGGARFVVIRTTEFYSIEVLLELVEKILKNVKGDYEIILNIGEFDVVTAERMFDGGVSGIYHAVRLREGINTSFNITDRLKTMQSVLNSPLKLISLVEPIGIEHTDAEIADNFLNIVKYKAEISGAMARVPVKGTPLGNIPIISEDRLAQIIAVLRLSGGNVIKDICVHPFSKKAVTSGANVVVVETGAIPRDIAEIKHAWNNFGLEDAKNLLCECGYMVKQK